MYIPDKDIIWQRDLPTKQCTYYPTNYTTQGIATEQQVLSICIRPVCTNSTTVKQLVNFVSTGFVFEVCNSAEYSSQFTWLDFAKVWQGDFFFLSTVPVYPVVFDCAVFIAVAGDWPCLVWPLGVSVVTPVKLLQGIPSFQTLHSKHFQVLCPKTHGMPRFSYFRDILIDST